ncbi:hypothetical protein V8C44DRAFT_353496 [Trichoderma aethiopicum]
MSQRHHRHHAQEPAVARAPGPAPAPERSRAVEELHPVLLDLILRMNIVPPGDIGSLSEAALGNAVSLAISMLPDDEQTHIVSRIMTDDEIARERLDHPRLQNLQSRVMLSQNERRLLLRASPEPDEDDANQDEGGANGCIICFDRNSVAVPCGCRYCASCLRELVRVGLRSETDFPPRCCRPFDEATIRLAGRPALVHLFRQLSAEYAVPPAQRLYCHNASCASFIPPSAIQAAARDEANATAFMLIPMLMSIIMGIMGIMGIVASTIASTIASIIASTITGITTVIIVSIIVSVPSLQASPESWMHEASDWKTYYSKFGPPTHASMLEDAR